MISSETLYLIALTKIKYLGPHNLKKLLVKTKRASTIFQMSSSDLSFLKIPKEIKSEILNKSTLSQAEAEVKYAEKNEIKIIDFFSKDYPDLLKHCEDAPLILYIKGNTNFRKSRILAIVGTRKASHRGIELCERLVHGLKDNDVVIVSGLALGIDSAAHQNALLNDLETWAVVGHSMDRLYPPQNRLLSERIIENGSLITDFPTSAPMLPGNFPSRNRIIAGISHATVVVESGQGGGSLITSGIALSYGRDVFTFPTDPMISPGSACNKLIKKNEAALIESAQDVLSFMNWHQESNASRQTSLFPQLNDDEKRILEILDNCEEMRMDELSVKSAFPIHKLSALLLNLELKKVVFCSPGKIYRSCSK